MVKILIIAPDIVRPDTASGDLRFSQMICALAKVHRVEFLCPTPRPRSPTPDSPYWNKLESLGVKIISPRLFAHPEAAIAYSNPDILLCEFWHCAQKYVESRDKFVHLNPNLAVVVDSVDLHFVREEAGLTVGEGCPESVAQNKAAELKVYAMADSVLVVSDSDKLILSEHLPNVKSEVIPNFVNIATRNPELSRAQEIIFIGGFKHHPNIGAVQWFTRAIFPLIQTEVPNAQFKIVGSNPPPEVLELSSHNGVEVTGFVPETSPLLNKASVSVAPLLYGGGMKGKVTEALSHGIPVVTTTFGVQGLTLKPSEEILIANSESEFANAVCWVLKNPAEAERIGLQGQKAIERICGIETVSTRLCVHLIDLTKSRRTPTNVLNSLWRKVLRLPILINFAYRIIAQKIHKKSR